MSVAREGGEARRLTSTLAADRFYVVREGDGVVSSKPPGPIVNLR